MDVLNKIVKALPETAWTRTSDTDALTSLRVVVQTDSVCACAFLEIGHLPRMKKFQVVAACSLLLAIPIMKTVMYRRYDGESCWFVLVPQGRSQNADDARVQGRIEELLTYLKEQEILPQEDFEALHHAALSGMGAPFSATLH